jgi:hypothetical protein
MLNSQQCNFHPWCTSQHDKCCRTSRSQFWHDSEWGLFLILNFFVCFVIIEYFMDFKLTGPAKWLMQGEIKQQVICLFWNAVEINPIFSILCQKLGFQTTGNIITISNNKPTEKYCLIYKEAGTASLYLSCPNSTYYPSACVENHENLSQQSVSFQYSNKECLKYKSEALVHDSTCLAWREVLKWMPA